MGRHLCSLYRGVPPPPPRITPCTNMDPDECVIFAYDGVPAYRDPVISSPYVQSLCLPAPPPLPPHYSHLPFPLTSLSRGTVLSRLKDTIKAEISRPQIQKRLDNRNKSKAQGIPLGEFEHNSMAVRSSFEIFRLVKNRFAHLKAIFYRINLKNLCLIGKFMVQR